MLGKRKRATRQFASSARRKRYGVEEVTYDPQARQEYLTGFHKRKLQRQKQAQEVAALKEREERRRQRAQLRAERQEYLEQHVAAVNDGIKALEDVNSECTEQEGSDTEEEDTAVQPFSVDHQAEYEDDVRAATVVVEAVDVTRHGLIRAEDGPEHVGGSSRFDNPLSKPSTAQRQKNSGPQLTPAKKSKRKKKFRYESKAERKITISKERAAKKAKAQSRKRE